MTGWTRAIAVCLWCGGSAAAMRAQTKPAIDVCAIVTAAKAKATLGALTSQPAVHTDHVGFGVDSCMYVGPPVSGTGGQTVFLRLIVETGTGKDGPEMLQMDADKRKATVALPSLGDAATRNQAGTFVWARQAGVVCTAEVANGLPKGLTADSAASALGNLCRDVLAAVKK